MRTNFLGYLDAIAEVEYSNAPSLDQCDGWIVHGGFGNGHIIIVYIEEGPRSVIRHEEDGRRMPHTAR